MMRMTWAGLALMVILEVGGLTPAVTAETAESTRQLLLDENFDRLEEVFGQALAGLDPTDSTTIEPLVEAYDGLGFQPSDLALYERWLMLHPNSSFAHGARGVFMIDYAWHARGTGWAYMVKAEMWPLFEQRVEQARQDLLQSVALNPNDPFPRTRLLTVARAQGHPFQTVAEHFNAARQLAPGYLGLYLGAMEYLKPKWQGTHAEMFRFARNWANRAPADSNLAMILFWAHHEMSMFYNHGTEYWKQPEVWAEVEPILRRLRENPRYGAEMSSHLVLLHLQREELELARKEIESLGVDFDLSVFKLIDYYVYYRARCLGPEGGDRKIHWKWLREATGRRLLATPDDAGMIWRHGFAMMRLEDYQNALGMLSRAHQLDPLNPDYAYALGQVLMFLKRHREALEVLQRVDESYIFIGEVLMARGKCYRALEDYEAALAEFQRMVDLGHFDDEQLKMYLSAAIKCDKGEVALETINRSLEWLERDPESSVDRRVNLLLYRSDLYRSIKDNGSALQDLFEIQKLTGKNDDPRVVPRMLRLTSALAPQPGMVSQDPAMMLEEALTTLERDPTQVEAYLNAARMLMPQWVHVEVAALMVAEAAARLDANSPLELRRQVAAVQRSVADRMAERPMPKQSPPDQTEPHLGRFEPRQRLDLAQQLVIRYGAIDRLDDAWRVLDEIVVPLLPQAPGDSAQVVRVYQILRHSVRPNPFKLD